MRPSLRAAALLALGLVPPAAQAGPLSHETAVEASLRDPREIVLAAASRRPVLDASAIVAGGAMGPEDVWFDPAPEDPYAGVVEAHVDGPRFVLDDPEELARSFRNDDGASTSVLDLVLILAVPFVLPLVVRQRTAAVAWPDDDEAEEDGAEEEPGRASPM
jgi:hypothetical protein